MPRRSWLRHVAAHGRRLQLPFHLPSFRVVADVFANFKERIFILDSMIMKSGIAIQTPNGRFDTIWSPQPGPKGLTAGKAHSFPEARRCVAPAATCRGLAATCRGQLRRGVARLHAMSQIQ